MEIIEQIKWYKQNGGFEIFTCLGHITYRMILYDGYLCPNTFHWVFQMHLCSFPNIHTYTHTDSHARALVIFAILFYEFTTKV